MRFAVILALLTVGVPMGHVPAAIQASTQAPLPEAQPVLVWFTAVKNGDQEALKAAFSASMRRQFDQEGWAKVLMNYQDGFTREFGDYKVEDFTFGFTGGQQNGYVSIGYRGRALPAVNVIREETGWRVNER